MQTDYRSQQLMDFLRRHLFFMICGFAAAAGIVLGVTGIKAMSKVQEKATGPTALYRNLNALRSSGANMAMIEAEQVRIQLVKGDRDKVMGSARKLREYKPLVVDALPNGNATVLLEFQKRYGEQMTRLLDSLRYGVPATSREIETMRATIEEEEEEGIDFGFKSAGKASAGEDAPKDAAGVLTKAGARVNPLARSHIAAAQRIYCYAAHHAHARLPDRPASLEFEPGMKDTGSAEPPLLEDVWRAQIGYWIQSDVVNVIAAMNDQAAETARKEGHDRWVGIMPVKEVISIRLSPEYVMPDSEGDDPARAGGHTVAEPPGGPDMVFTRRASGPDFEVMQFTVKLVTDQRYIPDFVNRLSKSSFYTLLGLSYVAVPPNRQMVGKIYGEGPVVNVVMDFEAVMLGDVFRQWIPQEVCDDYEIACPEPEEEEEEGG